MILKLLQVYELSVDPKDNSANPEGNLVSPESESDWTILYLILTDISTISKLWVLYFTKLLVYE